MKLNIRISIVENVVVGRWSDPKPKRSKQLFRHATYYCLNLNIIEPAIYVSGVLDRQLLNG